MDWDNLRYFLAVARDGQMLAASRRLGVSQALLSRHINTLETQIGSTLLNRTTRGCILTEDGEALLQTAERVESEVLSGLSNLQGREEIAGTIRIGAPDGFGGAFLAPRLGRFRSAYPDLNIQLVPVPRSFSLSEREADIAIMVGRPKKGRLQVKKLVDFGLGLYASANYLDQVGIPEQISDLKAHSLVGYVDDLIYTQELNYTDDFFKGWQSQIQVSTAIGQFEAVSAGAGIGILHNFMVSGNKNLVRLFPEITTTRSYWIVWHENMKVTRRVKVVVDLLDQLVREERALF